MDDVPNEGSSDTTSSGCQRLIDKALTSNSAIRSLMSAMERAGCPVNRSFFSCEHCTQECQGGYDRSRGVILCQQHMLNSSQLIQSTMIHELIHAYDDCRAHVRWDDLKHHACTEIRAANLSGDCDFSQEFSRGNLNLRAQQQKCVRRRAELSVAMNPSSKGACAAAHCRECVLDIHAVTWSLFQMQRGCSPKCFPWGRCSGRERCRAGSLAPLLLRSGPLRQRVSRDSSRMSVRSAGEPGVGAQIQTHPALTMACLLSLVWDLDLGAVPAALDGRSQPITAMYGQ